MTPTESTIFTGLKRCVCSAKVQTAVGTLTAAYVTLHFSGVPQLPPTQQSAVWIGFLGLVGVLVRDVIQAWAAEDVADAQGPVAPVAPVAPIVPISPTPPLPNIPLTAAQQQAIHSTWPPK